MDEALKAKIDAMSRVDLARAWRFTPAGDPMFRDEAFQHFKKRFNSLGGMSPEISKEIGWEPPKTTQA